MAVSTSGEVERVHRHFVDVEALMAARDLRALDHGRQRLQALLLDELARYRRARRFPQNREFRNKNVPCFIDEAGTRCAVAHLLDVSGEGELALKIARSRAYARVRELSDEPRLVAWLEATGFTLDEAQKIQPAYCFVTAAAACFCMQLSPTVVEAVIDSGSSSGANVRIERIEGAPVGFKVGDVVSASVSSPPGTHVLLKVFSKEDAGSLPGLAQIVPLDTNSATATCQENAFTRSHPASTEALLQALTAGTTTDCEDRLAQEDPGWKGSRCDDPASADSSSGCGCAVGREDDGSSLEVPTTAALLAAVLRYRARRRRAGTRPGRVG